MSYIILWLFWYDEGIDDFALLLWEFSDICSRHTVGIAGDDIIYHILVYRQSSNISGTSIEN